jgi:hypothetical protein
MESHIQKNARVHLGIEYSISLCLSHTFCLVSFSQIRTCSKRHTLDYEPFRIEKRSITSAKTHQTISFIVRHIRLQAPLQCLLKDIHLSVPCGTEQAGRER